MATPTTAVPPAPTTPPATPPETPAPAAKKEIDPFVANLAKHVKIVLAEDEPAPAPVVEPVISTAELTIADRVLEKARVEAAKKKNPEDYPPELDDEPAPAPAAPAPAAETPPATPPPAPEKKVKTRKSSADKLHAKLEEMAAAIPPAPAEIEAPLAPAQTPTEVSDAEFEKSLNPDQIEMLEFARYAEGKFPEHKGKVQETVAYFKKFDAFVANNPDAGPESEEFREFINKNRPAFRDQRKIERQMIKEEATEAVRKELKPEVDRAASETEQLRREVRVRPAVDKAVEEFRESMSETEGLPLPEGVAGLDLAVVKAVSGMSQEQAMEEYPIEAPIILSTQNAAKEFLEVTSGLKPIDPKNSTHNWVINFIANQGEVVMQRPVDQRTRNGRTFVPRHEFNRMDDSARRKHFTFSDDEVLDLLAANAHIAVHNQSQKLTKAGWMRKTITAPENNTPAPAPATPPKAGTSNPPKAGASMSPGAANTKRPNANASWLNSRFPGASEIVGA